MSNKMTNKIDFKKKNVMELYLINNFKELTKAKYDENGRGDNFGKIIRLYLYYSNGVHVATWDSSGKKGWIFIKEEIKNDETNNDN